MLRIAPAPWSAAFRDPDRTLARAAIRRGAAQKVRELTPLVREVRALEPRVVVEIGTDLGGTLFVWCQLATADATIVSIDLPGAAFGRREARRTRASIERYARPGQHIHLLEADSHEAQTVERLREVLAGRSIDLLMIDGDHTYEGVRADFELYSAFVGRNGMIVFHDILPSEIAADCEVDRLWSELRGRYRVAEFVDTYDDRGRGQWGGLGVIRWEQDAGAAT